MLTAPFVQMELGRPCKALTKEMHYQGQTCTTMLEVGGGTL
jgi:hypothetical protein